MGGRRALLGPADVQDGVGEIDLIPTQVYKLGRPQAVAEGDKDHGGIPVTPAIGLGGIDQPIDLGAGQVLYSAFRFRLGVVTVRFTVAVPPISRVILSWFSVPRRCRLSIYHVFYEQLKPRRSARSGPLFEIRRVGN